MSVTGFYDQLAPFYHLVYPDWEASIKRQASELDGIIREFWGEDATSILDVACGIGTQSLGLAQLDYTVTASDLSNAEIERAKEEAGKRVLEINFSIADMREVYTHHQRQFDVVIACDNAVPHLLTDEDILIAFRQFYACTRPGGGCIISVRDYEKEERSGVQVKPYGLHMVGKARYLIFQVWAFRDMVYEMSMYLIEDRGGSDCITQVMRADYYAVEIDKLISLMRQAGFRQVQRLDRRFFQPVIIGTRN